jgi:heme A synthase
MSLVEVHARLANTLLLYVIVLAVWGLWRYFRRQGVDSNYWGALVILEIVIVAQGMLGAYLWFINALRPERGGIHILYGVISALAIPIVYVYTKGGDQRRDMIVYAAVLLFTIGLVLRAISTGA